MKYQLEQRLIQFSESIISFCQTIKHDIINRPIISQVVRSSMSVGANYCEACNASSYKDFRNKLYICKKEINETKYWLVILAKSNPNYKEKLRKIYDECLQLTKIIQSIIMNLNDKLSKHIKPSKRNKQNFKLVF